MENTTRVSSGLCMDGKLQAPDITRIDRCRTGVLVNQPFSFSTQVLNTQYSMRCVLAGVQCISK